MLSLAEASAQIRNRKISSVELTDLCLDRIAKLNPQLNAFITVTEELAHQQARQADREYLAGRWRGPLHGIPVALKDLIDVAGVKTTAASRQLAHNVATRDAVVIERLKQAGAVILGKTNLHEFAFGGSGLISAYGPARNPWDTTRITGGSSSGAAAAVATGMCVAAIATDTAGSIRAPAALCGIVGHRPSAAVLSFEGVIPLRKSFDTIGPMARTVDDAWMLLRALVADSTVSSLDRNIRKIRVGVPRAKFFGGLDTAVAQCIEQALGVIRSLVAEIKDLDLEVNVPWTDFNEEILEFHRHMMETSPQLYEPDTLQRLRACTTISESAYQQAHTALVGARRQAERIFDQVDIVVTPTCLVAAPKIAELQALSDLRAYEVQSLLENTAPFSLLFWPSVSVPCGFTEEALPVGMQISARLGADELALRTAHAYEQATEWYKRVPLLAS